MTYTFSNYMHIIFTKHKNACLGTTPFVQFSSGQTVIYYMLWPIFCLERSYMFDSIQRHAHGYNISKDARNIVQ